MDIDFEGQAGFAGIITAACRAALARELSGPQAHLARDLDAYAVTMQRAPHPAA